jgi:hypothetical protein
VAQLSNLIRQYPDRRRLPLPQEKKRKDQHQESVHLLICNDNNDIFCNAERIGNNCSNYLDLAIKKNEELFKDCKVNELVDIVIFQSINMIILVVLIYKYYRHLMYGNTSFLPEGINDHSSCMCFQCL